MKPGPRGNFSLNLDDTRKGVEVLELVNAGNIVAAAAKSKEYAQSMGDWLGALKFEMPADSGGDVLAATYSPNDDHPTKVVLQPGMSTSVPFVGPGKVSAAIPEGANGGQGAQLNIATAPGDAANTAHDVSLVSPAGRGLLAQVSAQGALFAVLSLPPGAPDSTVATFNVGPLR